ncbi:MAG: hypothetical protein BKP49_09690 [Treponema sp. CETP13]|nr:MAG: hypothetical protein BKP49_09690 [Treponema sp. CETP13]
MKLTYIPITVKLNFDIPIKFDIPPLFVLRSVLGWQLRRLCCIATDAKCQDCKYHKSCVYSYVFETILDKTNQVQQGINRASHPFVFSDDNKVKLYEPIKTYSFKITLIGKAVDYIPYIYAALQKAGSKGLLKNRIPFKVERLLYKSDELLINDEKINTNFSKLIWDKSFATKKSKATEILVQLKSPLRFKSNGKYSTNFTAEQFFSCLERRYKTLFLLYGEGEDISELSYKSDKITISDRNLKWQDSKHYSARQRNVMKLGGAVGNFLLKGNFTEAQLSLLEFSKIFSAGKNTNFGLGQIDYWIR